VLGAEASQRAIKQYHGFMANKVLKGFLDDFAGAGVDRAKTLAWIDRRRAAFTKSVIGANPMVFLKQLASIPAYAMEIPSKDFISGVAYALSHPKEVHDILMTSPTMKARAKIGHERDIILAGKRSPAKALAGTQQISDVLMLSTKLGDRLAVVAGGWSVYSYHLKRLVNSGMAKEQAHKEALYQFDMATKRSQQAGDTMDLAYLQRLGSIGNLFTMFLTAPLAYYRNMSAGMRNLKGGRGSASDVKRVLLTWTILPMLFQWIASGFEWDEEAQARAALVGPLNGLFMAREAIEAIGTKWFEGKSYMNVGTPPPLTAIRTAVRATGSARKMWDDGITEKELGKFFDTVAEVAGNLSGIPYKPVSKIVSYLNDDE